MKTKTFNMFVNGQLVATFDAKNWTEAKWQGNSIMAKRGQLHYPNNVHYVLRYAN